MLPVLGRVGVNWLLDCICICRDVNCSCDGGLRPEAGVMSQTAKTLPANTTSWYTSNHNKGNDNSSGARGACVGSSGRDARLNHHFCFGWRYVDSLYFHVSIMYLTAQVWGTCAHVLCFPFFAHHETLNSVIFCAGPLHDRRFAPVTPTQTQVLKSGHVF